MPEPSDGGQPAVPVPVHYWHRQGLHAIWMEGWKDGRKVVATKIKPRHHRIHENPEILKI
ncbi:uncharacterized protein Dana_GF26377, isoform A [Drosophila ananassae]|uniref:Uncharacterized protein, isoform A n=1 Tax=Drosophila ananassae TaxID=7217 RepID=A0A0P8XH13_DROAN|nr:uncharacterized protein Dana_GF26377, isoform A [Drosophila ananassae]